eukprot:318107-Chlamydomonas_euryale.AAC.2
MDAGAGVGKGRGGEKAAAASALPPISLPGRTRHPPSMHRCSTRDGIGLWKGHHIVTQACQPLPHH